MQCLLRAGAAAAILGPALILGGCEWGGPGSNDEAEVSARERALAKKLQAACSSPATYDRLKQIAFDEASLHVESLDRTDGYKSWVRRGDEKQPAMSVMLGDLPPLTVTRYRTVALPSGEVESRWYAFPEDDYPDVANRASENNWLHASVHGNGSCPICQSGD